MQFVAPLQLKLFDSLVCSLKPHKTGIKQKLGGKAFHAETLRVQPISCHLLETPRENYIHSAHLVMLLKLLDGSVSFHLPTSACLLRNAFFACVFGTSCFFLNFFYIFSSCLSFWDDLHLFFAHHECHLECCSKELLRKLICHALNVDLEFSASMDQQL